MSCPQAPVSADRHVTWTHYPASETTRLCSLSLTIGA
jgi:hypothetical protein